jgi:hypothetical protein
MDCIQVAWSVVPKPLRCGKTISQRWNSKLPMKFKSTRRNPNLEPATPEQPSRQGLSGGTDSWSYYRITVPRDRATEHQHDWPVGGGDGDM